MRKRFAGFTLAAALTLGAIVTSHSDAFAEDINITAVAGHPPVFRWVKMIPEVFIPTVQKLLEGSGHTFNVDLQAGGSIAKVGEELEAIGEGLAEIGTVQALFDPAKLAVQNVTYYTPFVSSDVNQISNMMDRLHKEDARLQQAYTENNIVYLGAPIGIDDYLLMTNFPVNSLADLEGKKIAAPGAAINWLSGTGAVGVSGNLTTYYNELKTGVYDGVIVFASAAVPGKLYEVAPNVTRMGLGAQFAGVLGANKDWYDSLPDDVKAALHTGADAAKDWYNSDLTGFAAKALEIMAANGATVKEAPEEMRMAWARGMDNAAKTWAADLDAKGVKGSEVLSLYMEEMRKAGATPLRDWDRE
jgi:TRAP-type C4-dicarboxylate transport system substrate-binding protein